jgi:hypothetical protein
MNRHVATAATEGHSMNLIGVLGGVAVRSFSFARSRRNSRRERPITADMTERLHVRTTQQIIAEASAQPPIAIRRSYATEQAILFALVCRVAPVITIGLCPFIRSDVALVLSFSLSSALLVAGELSRL